MKIFENTDLFVADKPAGLSTHRADAQGWGFVEYATERLRLPLFVVHRLDKETTGVILFAKNTMAAAALTQLFEEKKIAKKYLFITDRPFHGDDVTLSSLIERGPSGWTSQPEGKPNSSTHFKKLLQREQWTVWQATPFTGKTHQIRLHAAALGIPILGDTLYGGTPFSQLLLHAWKISHASPTQPALNFEFTAEPSLVYEFPEMIAQDDVSKWYLAIDRRQRLFREFLSLAADRDAPTTCVRLIHSEGGPLRCDQFGDVNWFYWYKETPPSNTDLKNIEALSLTTGARHWILRWMVNRGQNAHARDTWSSENPPEKWIARENGAHFELRKMCGSSPGLFLDQRENRRWLKSAAGGKSILNLFCYTAGFSTVAALAGAREVVSVDTNSVVLDWAKQNFLANHIPLDDRYSFFRADARFFLERAVTKHRKFDIIVCDPPSFGRGPEGVFRIEKDLPHLIQNMAACLNAGGVILFSINYEAWTWKEFTRAVTAEAERHSLVVESSPRADLDFELLGQESIMKSIRLRKD